MIKERESSEVLTRAIALLPEKEKEVVAMRNQGELSFKEIAEIVWAPIGTVLACPDTQQLQSQPAPSSNCPARIPLPDPVNKNGLL
ncbi:MAG: sigma factor-like helix-turn-helix DNA-binding protein [Akkermansiaceae bacterium]